MIKLKKLILTTMLLGFSSLSVAHANQASEVFADGISLHSQQTAYIGKGGLDIGEQNNEHELPFSGQPIVIGLSVDEEVEMLPRPIGSDVCTEYDACNLFMSPQT